MYVPNTEETSMNAPTSLMTRASIDEIVGYRGEAIDLFAKGQALMARAMEAATKATGGRGIHVTDQTLGMAFSRTRGDDFLDEIRRTLDASAWRHLVMGYGFEKLMDRQAKSEFEAQLVKDPPPLDAKIAESTMLQLMGDSEKLFRRGIANAFSRLDRRFRSHDGFKIGSRIVLDRAFNEDGYWNSGNDRKDEIRDIERMLFRLDGVDVPESYAGIIGEMDRIGNIMGYGAKSYETSGEFFRVKTYKNGNVHLWFTRDDLVEKVNRLLAEHYGEVLGAGSDTFADAGFDFSANQKTDLAKNLGWFATPARVAKDVVSRGEIMYARGYLPEGRSTIRILEPSAGEGALAMAALDALAQGDVRGEVTCVEVHPDRAQWLETAGFRRENGHRTVRGDFLQCRPEELGLFDVVVMNPPFDLQRDIDHVMHAVRFLAPGGRLVAVMSAGVAFRENRKAIAFREAVTKMRGDIWDLSPGSFEESGTNVNTCIVTMKAPRA